MGGAVAPRALDHIVLPCPDLAGVAASLDAAGFTVSGRNRHPWGTENHVIQFPGVFLELIAPGADYRPLAPEDDAFPFAGPLAGQGPGPASSGMLVWRSSNADADAAQFATLELGEGRRLHFGRTNRAPDGSERRVAFSLAFAKAPALPDLGVFTCQQHHPENFWAPAVQRHPNGATGVQGVLIEAADPPRVAATLAALAGSVVEPGRDCLVVPLAEGAHIAVATKAGALSRLAGVTLRGPADASLPSAGAVALDMVAA